MLVNDDLDRSFKTLESILAAEHLRRERQVGLSGFVGRLLAEGGASPA